MPSDAWGETPVGFVRLHPRASSTPEAILERVNGQLGKTQRISVLYPIDEMPRSHIGKLLKTDLRALAAELQNGR
jgi:acyl-CoA synthetase (AMP-forming)/AMP-acid ligase II